MSTIYIYINQTCLSLKQTQVVNENMSHYTSNNYTCAFVYNQFFFKVYQNNVKMGIATHWNRRINNLFFFLLKENGYIDKIISSF